MVASWSPLTGRDSCSFTGGTVSPPQADLTRKGPNGQILYFHHVLEAKLLTANGFAFSLATEFIENVDPHTDKSACGGRAEGL